MIKHFATILLSLCLTKAYTQNIIYKQDNNKFTLQELKINSDNTNWIMKTDGSQYKWADQKYSWAGVTIVCQTEMQKDSVYFDNSGQSGKFLKIEMSRKSLPNGNLVEKYTIKNISSEDLKIVEFGINTPFNDNYPSAKECIEGRVNAHIWAQGNSSYVAATRMSGQAPHIGLLLRKGSLDGYEIKGRSRENNMSNVRGIIVLNPDLKALKPEQSYTVEWEIFTFKNHSNFAEIVKGKGAVIGHADRYVIEKDDIANIKFSSSKSLRNVDVTLNGDVVKWSQKNGTITVSTPMAKLGDAVFELKYDDNKRELVKLLVISSEENILNQRANFIIDKQQYLNPSNQRYGAYLPYDNELNKIFLNDIQTVSYHDRDEGAERLGMGVFLAQQYQKTKNPKILNSLKLYTKFVRNQLQTPDHTTYSTYQHEGRNRAYNYPWIADLNVEMYKCTGDIQYLKDCYGTLKAMYRHFGHGFYAFGIPVSDGINLMKKEGLNELADDLLTDFETAAAIYIKNGTNYPPHEVNYEQTIVTPLVMMLTQLYQLTGKKEYLDEVERQLPLLESFSGFQPDYHLNELGIRHWDGYWFGKREFWGDTFPHYWTTLTAICYSLYADCTGKTEYQKRAENIVRNNLCQFFEDGKASCAYLYPNKVNGKPAQFYDPFANDQDWALVYYNKVIKN